MGLYFETCDHPKTVRVSSSVDLSESGPHRSTYCCDDDECRERAAVWVREICPDAVTVPLPRTVVDNVPA